MSWFYKLINSRAKYFIIVLILAVNVLIAYALKKYFDDISIVMIYMLTIVILSFFVDLKAALISCLFSVILFDFFNLPPYMQFSRQPIEYIFTLIVMFVTAASISILSSRLTENNKIIKDREKKTKILYQLSMLIINQEKNEKIINNTLSYIRECYNNKQLILLYKLIDNKCLIYNKNVNKKLCTDYQSMTIIVLKTEDTVYSIIVNQHLMNESDMNHLQTMISHVQSAIDQNILRHKIQLSTLEVQQERLRNTLLNAISHDLRTPLASIIGASSSLLDAKQNFSEHSFDKLKTIIYQEAIQMQNMVENLLYMAKIQSGITLNLEWQALEEVVSSAVATVRKRAKHHQIMVNVSDNLPLIKYDSMLMERVLINILENAIKYSPINTEIIICAYNNNEHIFIDTSDQGQGIPENLKNLIFQAFYQVKNDAAGFGLGLTICHAIISEHRGKIKVLNNNPQGTIIRLLLPMDEQPLFAE